MKDLSFNEYQKGAISTDHFGGGEHEVLDPAFIAKVLGLSGEAGEVAEKFKKIIRDKNGKLNQEDKDEIIKELGDVLWYNALIADYLGVDFNEVASLNLAKLKSRQERHQIHGSGDNR